MLFLGCSIVKIQFTYLLINIFKIIIIGIYISKNYKWVNLKEEPNYKAIEQKMQFLLIKFVTWFLEIQIL